MKKTVFMILKALAFVIALAAMLSSCSKKGADIYRGYYSFKTGGYLDIKGKVYEIKRDTVKIDTTITKIIIGGRTIFDTTYTYHTKNDTIGSRDTSFIRYLSAESGQMHVVGTDGNLKVTMNITGGNPVIFNARATNDAITLEPVKRQTAVIPDDEGDDKNVSFLFTASGTGHRYENMLLFDLMYQGEYNYDDMCGMIVPEKSSINCIATKNE